MGRTALLLTSFFLGSGLGPVPASNGGSSPDLCADVYLDDSGEPITDSLGTPRARFCEATGPNPPRWNGDVCCTFDEDEAHCAPPSSDGRCNVGARMRCEFGERAGGEVTCYQTFPDTCELGFCTDKVAPDGDIFSDVVCCVDGICYDIPPLSYCSGVSSFCINGATNEDGTTECFDDL